jgi:hypothetical protein
MFLVAPERGIVCPAMLPLRLRCAFTCTPTAVHNGDRPTVVCRGPKTRLVGTAAREMDGSSSPGGPIRPQVHSGLSGDYFSV